MSTTARVKLQPGTSKRESLLPRQPSGGQPTSSAPGDNKRGNGKNNAPPVFYELGRHKSSDHRRDRIMGSSKLVDPRQYVTTRTQYQRSRRGSQTLRDSVNYEAEDWAMEQQRRSPRNGGRSPLRSNLTQNRGLGFDTTDDQRPDFKRPGSRSPTPGRLSSRDASRQPRSDDWETASYERNLYATLLGRLDAGEGVRKMQWDENGERVKLSKPGHDPVLELERRSRAASAEARMRSEASLHPTDSGTTMEEYVRGEVRLCMDYVVQRVEDVNINYHESTVYEYDNQARMTSAVILGVPRNDRLIPQVVKLIREKFGFLKDLIEVEDTAQMETDALLNQAAAVEAKAKAEAEAVECAEGVEGQEAGEEEGKRDEEPNEDGDMNDAAAADTDATAVAVEGSGTNNKEDAPAADAEAYETKSVTKVDATKVDGAREEEGVEAVEEPTTTTADADPVVVGDEDENTAVKGEGEEGDVKEAERKRRADKRKAREDAVRARIVLGHRKTKLVPNPEFMHAVNECYDQIRRENIAELMKAKYFDIYGQEQRYTYEEALATWIGQRQRELRLLTENEIGTLRTRRRMSLERRDIERLKEAQCLFEQSEAERREKERTDREERNDLERFKRMAKTKERKRRLTLRAQELGLKQNLEAQSGIATTTKENAHNLLQPHAEVAEVDGDDTNPAEPPQDPGIAENGGGDVTAATAGEAAPTSPEAEAKARSDEGDEKTRDFADGGVIAAERDAEFIDNQQTKNTHVGAEGETSARGSESTRKSLTDPVLPATMPSRPGSKPSSKPASTPGSARPSVSQKRASESQKRQSTQEEAASTTNLSLSSSIPSSTATSAAPLAEVKTAAAADPAPQTLTDENAHVEDSPSSELERVNLKAGVSSSDAGPAHASPASEHPEEGETTAAAAELKDPCENCEEEEVAAECADCGMSLCLTCDAELHATAKTAEHVREYRVPCTNCEEQGAIVSCEACGDVLLCAECNDEFHSSKKTKSHTRVPVVY